MKRFVFKDEPTFLELFPSQRDHPYAHHHISEVRLLNVVSVFTRITYNENGHPCPVGKFDAALPEHVLFIYFERPVLPSPKTTPPARPLAHASA